MPEYASFEDFARDHFLFNAISGDILDDDEPEPIRFMVDFMSFTETFEDAHCDYFYKIYDKHEFRNLQSDEDFLRFALPLCLNLVDSERCFYSILLITSFLHEFLSFLLDVRACHRFRFTAYKCLAAAFKRALESSFESSGGWKGFRKYLKGLKKDFRTTKLRRKLDILNKGDPSLREKVIELLKGCDDASNEGFELNSYELSLLKDDVVAEVLNSLDEPGEDPLGLEWPPDREEIQKKLQSAEDDAKEDRKQPEVEDSTNEHHEGVQKSTEGKSKWELILSCCEMNYSNTENDSDSDDEFDFEISRKSHFELTQYIRKLEGDARKRLVHEDFYEKMELRKCPCCGIACFQLSLQLYSKQLGSALIRVIPIWEKAVAPIVRLYWDICLRFGHLGLEPWM